MGIMVTGSIVTYNNMSTIDETLKTLYEYTKDINFKLYVVDNNSTDGTVEHIKENYPQVEVVALKENIGFGAGHNKAVRMVDSDYHVIINPDIVFIENSIKKMVDYLENNEDIGVLSPKICFPDGREQILGKKDPHFKYILASRLRGDEPGTLLKKYAMLDCDLTKPIDIENASGCFMVFRTSILKKVDGFDERYFMYFEDADITRKARKYSRVVYYPEAVVSHVWNRDSKHNFKLLAIHIHSMLKYYWKWKTI
ncbi:MAG: glycosyltransferase family 2 protein [Acutalibacteraceae bacterium]|nr:glycosyltransferase family 2 protein [Acutalibacteraceae bacterium]